MLQSIRLRLMERLLSASRETALKLGRVRALPAHLEMGERGELAALFLLQQSGFVVVARRWQSAKQRGDLDLVAWEQDTLCFVEVKTRGGHGLASAETAVDEDKRTMLRRMAKQYMKGVIPPAVNVRFDVVAVYLTNDGRQESRLFRHAFGW